MSDLIVRLQEAESGSRDLDEAIFEVAFADTAPNIVAWIPAYTTSLDAVTDLIASKASEHLFGPVSITIAGSAECHIASVFACGEGWQAFGKTPPLACCIALLSALQAQAEGEP